MGSVLSWFGLFLPLALLWKNFDLKDSIAAYVWLCELVTGSIKVPPAGWLTNIRNLLFTGRILGSLKWDTRSSVWLAKVPTSCGPLSCVVGANASSGSLEVTDHTQGDISFSDDHLCLNSLWGHWAGTPVIFRSSEDHCSLPSEPLTWLSVELFWSLLLKICLDTLCAYPILFY